MIFLGDTAVPHSYIDSFISAMDLLPEAKVILNLEGGVCSFGEEGMARGLFNAEKLFPVLEEKGVVAVMLANNHISDLGEENVSRTKNELKRLGIGVIGLKQEEPFVLDESGVQTVHIGFGWNYIQCRSKHISLFSRKTVLTQILRCKKEFPKAKIVVHCHWDFELEAYPMPSQRSLAREMIERYGVALVIGHHPHRVQGVECFEGGVACYSLGNWFLPQGVFMNGRLKYPEAARTILAVDWEPVSGCVTPLWFFQKEDNSLEKRECKEAELFIENLSFRGLSDSEYISWFRKNREKRLLLPVMTEKDGELSQMVWFVWIKIREKLISCVLCVKSLIKV